VLRAKECTPTPSPSTIFTFGLEVESIKKFGGVLDKLKKKFVFFLGFGIQFLVFKVLMCLVFFHRFLSEITIQQAKKGVESQRKIIKIG
jgi:hypothetical protein